MSFSIDFMAKWLAEAKTANEMAMVNSWTMSSITMLHLIEVVLGSDIFSASEK
jgi:hypothetical protein